MKKSDLLNFVGRYHLAGATTSVKWDAKDGALQTEFITDDQNVIGHINASNLDLGSNELGENAKKKAVDNFKGAVLGGAIGIALGIATRKNIMISGLIGLVIGRLIFVK